MKPYIRKVQYFETDMMGVVHHANYIHWMEEARIDFMDQLGYPYWRMEEEGVMSPVRALSCQYRKPCAFGDEIAIAVSVASFNGVVLTIRYDMRKGADVVCEARSEHVFVRKGGGIVRMKRDMPGFCAAIEALIPGELRGEKTGGKAMRNQTIYLAGGCFWGVQKFFDQFDGVTGTQVGYANGPDAAPSYQDVCNDSGHAETVRVDYDPSIVSLGALLERYFMVVDPLSVNRQGHDEGIQYRTGIYYTDASQLPEIEAVYRAQEAKAGQKLAVELQPLENFFTAEEYHQKYLDKNPGGYCHIPRAMLEMNRRGSL